MIHIKDGGVSSYYPLPSLLPKEGDTFINKEGTLLIFVRRSGYVNFIRTDFDPHTIEECTISSLALHHTFKRVEVELTIKATIDG